MNSITKRWIKGSLLIIIILLAVAEIFLVTTFRNSYYSSAQTALTNRINTIEGTLAAYGRMSGEEKQRLMFRLTEEFAEKESFELMLLNDAGNILATSSGLNPVGTDHKEDFIKCCIFLFLTHLQHNLIFLFAILLLKRKKPPKITKGILDYDDKQKYQTFGDPLPIPTAQGIASHDP